MNYAETEDNKCCMVCISTRQNTANYTPFQQLGLDFMIVLETDHAQQEGWGRRLEKVVKNHGKKITLHSLGSGTDLNEMVRLIREQTAATETVVWNIGGGQKMQQMALVSVFFQRKAAGKKDWACYSDPGTKRLYEIRTQGDELVSVERGIGADVTLDDVLTIFGLEQQGNSSPLLLWKASAPDISPPKHLFRDVTLFYQKDERERMFKWAMTKSGDEPPVLSGLKHGLPDYFEQVVQHQVRDILANQFPHHHVSEAWANVRVKDPETSKEIAEWDVVLVTNFGTLVILDAKTGIFDSKDESARLFQLERATGVYGEFWLVIPYMREDMVAEGLFDQLGEPGKAARKIPFELSKLQSKCLAITGDRQPIVLRKGKKDKVFLLDEQGGSSGEKGKKVLLLPNFHGFLQETKLLKQLNR